MSTVQDSQYLPEGHCTQSSAVHSTVLHIRSIAGERSKCPPCLVGWTEQSGPGGGEREGEREWLEPSRPLIQLARCHPSVNPSWSSGMPCPFLRILTWQTERTERHVQTSRRIRRARARCRGDGGMRGRGKQTSMHVNVKLHDSRLETLSAPRHPPGFDVPARAFPGRIMHPKLRARVEFPFVCPARHHRGQVSGAR